jgi:NDP-sugar pyrophosphorylase family protein
VGALRRFSFAGIHVVEPRIFGLSPRHGTFSIITLYLELAAAGWRVLPVDVSAHRWIDVGTPTRLAEAERMFGK